MAPIDCRGFRGRWVMVTGASSGLGAAFARRLATREGANLILVARRQDRMAALAEELRATGVEVLVKPCDLARPGAAVSLYDEVSAGREVFALILSAATYWFGDFQSMEQATVDEILAVNVASPLALIRRSLPDLDRRGAGAILLVTSTSALMPAPGQAVYAATKAMLQSFVGSLYYERGGARAAVPVCVCSPGGMSTEMLLDSPAMDRLQDNPLIMQMIASPDEVAARALASLIRGEPVEIPGLLNRAMVRLARHLPARLVGTVAARVYGYR